MDLNPVELSKNKGQDRDRAEENLFSTDQKEFVRF